MDRAPVTIGQVIDGEMARLLGIDGWDSYRVLCRQTQETRTRIVAAVKSRRDEYEAEAAEDLLGYHMVHQERELQARFIARERVQKEIEEKIAAEEARFKEASDALFKWAARRQEGDCPSCG